VSGESQLPTHHLRLVAFHCRSQRAYVGTCPAFGALRSVNTITLAVGLDGPALAFTGAGATGITKVSNSIHYFFTPSEKSLLYLAIVTGEGVFHTKQKEAGEQLPNNLS